MTTLHKIHCTQSRYHLLKIIYGISSWYIMYWTIYFFNKKDRKKKRENILFRKKKLNTMQRPPSCEKWDRCSSMSLVGGTSGSRISPAQHNILSHSLFSGKFCKTFTVRHHQSSKTCNLRSNIYNLILKIINNPLQHNFSSGTEVTTDGSYR